MSVMHHSNPGAPAMLAEARQVCPTTTLRMSREGTLRFAVRERNVIDGLAFDVPDVVVVRNWACC